MVEGLPYIRGGRIEPSQAGAGQASTLDDILTGLTDPQREAVLHSQGPLLVIAGPGAGKTRVIAHRVAYFVHSAQVNPANTLAVTFVHHRHGRPGQQARRRPQPIPL